MTMFTVHIYREMRLTFREIEAKDQDDAARIAHDLSLKAADELDECDGETFAALVNFDGDDDYELSRIIDFEGERLRKAARRSA
ncbi:hypothetical protein BH10PLA2_BH10PLA2_34790 [soil metagenome]